MNGETFLRKTVGDESYEVLATVAERLPGLESVILPRVALAWLHVADELGFEGEIPGTDALLKAGEVSFGGYAATVKTEIIGAATLVCQAAGCQDLGLPERLDPRHVARLAKFADTMTKSRFLRRVKELEKTASKSSSDSETTTPGQPDDEESTLEKGVELPGKAAEPRGPQAPSAPAPQVKQPGQAQQKPEQPIGAMGPQKPGT